MRRAFMLVVAVLISSPPVAGAQVAVDEGRPIVILIHGRKQSGTPEIRLRNAWFSALRAGLTQINQPNLLTDRDRRFVYYGSIYRDDYVESATCRNGGYSGVTVDDAPPERHRRTLTNMIKDGLTEIIVKRGGSIVQSLAVRAFDDTRAYVEGGTRHCDTNLVLSTALRNARDAKRPIVLVAHSMGGLVAYRVLDASTAAGNPYPVERLITIGTQLGVEGMVPYLAGRAAAYPYRFPGAVRQWANIYGEDDYLGWSTEGNFVFPGTRHADIKIDTPAQDVHGATGYLSHATVARAIAGAWCKAFRGPALATKPQACTAIDDIDFGS